MSNMYKQFCDAQVGEHNFEKAKRIVDEMIAINDPDVGKACGSIAWTFYVDCKDPDQAFKYAVKGCEHSDGNSFECLADLNYEHENYEKAYEYLLKASELGNDIPDFKFDMYKREADKTTKKDKKQGCYIATCVYGSYDCPQVWTLRRYRDFVLAKSIFGRLFIKIYYAISPLIVDRWGKNKWFKALWKKLLDKKVIGLNHQGIANTPYMDRR